MKLYLHLTSLCLAVAAFLPANTATAKCETFTVSKNRKGTEIIVMRSALLPADDTVAIFSPRRAKGDVPTLFLLHGRSGNWHSWQDNMDVQALADETGFRIICPDGFRRGWYMNGDIPGAARWRTFFWDELWPELDGRFHFNPKKTFITGLSMGGHGAMNLFLDHPDRFRGAGSMSGVLNLTHSGTAGKDFKKILATQDGRNETQLLENSAVNRLERIAQVCSDAASEKILLICCGSADKRYVPTSYDFADRCRSLGLHYVLMVSPGKHKWPCWVWTIRYQIDWFTQTMQGGKLGL